MAMWLTTVALGTALLKRRQPTKGEVGQRLAQACGSDEAGEERVRVKEPETGAGAEDGKAEP